MTRDPNEMTALHRLEAVVRRLVELGRQHRHSLAFLLIGLVICSIYLPVLTGARSLITNGSAHTPLFIGDPNAGGPITLPLERAASISWSHLQLPVVDPFQGYGIPLLPDQGVPVYFPQLLVHALFPGNYSIWIVLNLMAIAFGSYLLASSFGQRFAAALAVGLTASLSGAVPPNLNMGMLNPLAIFPFLLVAIRFSLDPHTRFRKSGLLGTATCVALLSLSGFQEVLPLMAVVIAIYAVALVVHFKGLRQRPGLILATVASAAVGLVIGSIGLLPSLAALRQGASINNAGSFALHVPTFWLGTLTMPSLTQHALAGSPVDLGQTVWTLGSPVLVVALVLSLAISVRPGGAPVRWYVWPSLAIALFGIFGYADVLHVLQIFNLPVFTNILTIRFLQFVWWIPWCLLLGTVISEVRLLCWYDAPVSLAVAGAFDLYFVSKFRDQLVAEHLGQYLSASRHAAILAGVIALVFVAAFLVVRWTTPRVASMAMTVVVAASCIYYLPTNFFPASAGTAARSVAVPGAHPQRGTYLSFLSGAQQPTTYFSAQVWGPIIPKPYQDVMSALFSPAETNGFGALFDAAPSMGLATVTPRVVEVLRSLGVDQFVSATALPATSGFGSIGHCTSSPTFALLCFAGRSTNDGGPPATRGYAYDVLDASPLVLPDAHPVAVSSNNVGLADVLARSTPTATTIPMDAYVTTTGHHLLGARGIIPLRRTATMQTVSYVLRSHTAGLIVLRATYAPGLRASVDGVSAPALPVDGGLWTAVHVGAGTSHIVLDYETTADRIEVSVAALGVLALLLAWIALAAPKVMRWRRMRRSYDAP